MSALTIVSRLLKFFPALVLAFVLFSLGMAVRECLFQAADQLITVQHTVGGR